MADLLSLGELLIDFTPVGTSENNNPIFERNPGGGPANMACAYAKLGGSAAFVGKVGDDNFGRALKAVLEQNRVDAGNLVLSKDYQTTLAFVHLDDQGDRSFSFYRRQGADTMLSFEEIDLEKLRQAKFLFFSSVLMTEGPSRETSFQLAEYACEQKKSTGLQVVFDPNLRLNLWNSEEDARQCALRAMRYADIVKISEEELTFLTGEQDLHRAAKMLLETYPVKLLLATLGKKGCFAMTGSRTVSHEGFPEVKTIDTTAAGDSFTGGFLYALTQMGKDAALLDKDELTSCIEFANAVGSLTTTKKGAICALPTLSEVEALIASRR